MNINQAKENKIIHKSLSTSSIKNKKKNLSLKIYSLQNNFEKNLTITPWGIQGKPKLINYEEGNPIYFGYGNNRKIDFNLPNESNLNKTDIFFQINYDFLSHKYFLKDMGEGFGTYIKIENNELKDNNIINIGNSYLIISDKLKDNKSDNKLYVKVYNNQNDCKEYIIGKKNFYSIGKGDKCDIKIFDRMISTFHCYLILENSIWKIVDGEKNGNQSTNGTWIYTLKEIEIKDNMVFKSNDFYFNCKYVYDCK